MKHLTVQFQPGYTTKKSKNIKTLTTLSPWGREKYADNTHTRFGPIGKKTRLGQEPGENTKFTSIAQA